MRISRNLCRLATVVFALSLLGSANAQLFWRVSVKVFTDANGNRPVDRTDAEIQDDYGYYNKLLGIYARGCQFQLTEIVQLPSSLSSRFNIDPRNASNRDALLTDATANRSLFAYRDNAINVYINNASSGICCGTGNGLIFIGRENDHITPLHEIGHMLGLPHTQGTNCNNCCPDPLGCCDAPGDDGFADTIFDLPCWNSQDLIAQNNFGQSYASLNASRKNQVDSVWFNIMSYHYGSFNNCLERLTPDQLDFVADMANGRRANIASGRTVFVDQNNSCPSPNDLLEPFRTIANLLTDIPYGASKCRTYVLNPPPPPPGLPPLDPLTVSLGGPFRRFAEGLAAASSGDVVLVRAGHYNEPRRITQRVTLAGSRGTVRIGRP